ncbi:MAG: Gfo/Idh/MocA family oxidoreductase [Candidatus Omnitrophota bacterium]|nr:Gfo/Idh/MocA family oxidoreductase [Candidatus Omnitrophota bacterium]MDZ4241560.1 Gfo/Idh/MocA family oxidoreductase [Candidatus Omnitrophota bacterium]
MSNTVENQPKVGILGLGYWGKNILRNLSELGILHTACDTNQGLLDQHAKQFPGAKFVSDFDSIFSDPQIPALVISTPAATHYDLVKRALNAGKDVFVEKPLALTYAQGEELVRLSQSNGKILMVGHILQFHPAVIKLKELIKTGVLGKVQYIYSNRLNIGKLRVEENILWSFAPHDISVILMLAGEEPQKVSCEGESYLNDGIFDITLTHLEFRNKIKAHVFVSWLHPFKEQKLVVIGSNSMAVFDDMSKEKLFLYPHQIRWEDGKIPVAQKAECNPVPIDTLEPLKEELQHFYTCVMTRQKPKTDGEEGLRVLKVLEQAERNLRKD